MYLARLGVALQVAPQQTGKEEPVERPAEKNRAAMKSQVLATRGYLGTAWHQLFAHVGVP